jgi:hypothetical protein
MPYDPATPAGQVRLLISDTSPDPVFSDAEITTFLSLCQNSVKRAAARALETIAADEALTSKVITDHDLSTNGAALAAELRQLAASLRGEAVSDDALTSGTPLYSFPDPDAKIDLTAMGWL